MQTHDIASLLCASLAPAVEDDAAMKRMLVAARANNVALGISGALLRHANFYLQVLEGEQRTVQALYERIRCDTRHFDVRLIAVHTLPRRQFEGWAMRELSSPPAQDMALTAFLRKLWRGLGQSQADVARDYLRRLANDPQAALSASSPNAARARRSATGPLARRDASPSCADADTAAAAPTRH